jgi:hypothetical protein
LGVSYRCGVTKEGIGMFFYKNFLIIMGIGLGCLLGHYTCGAAHTFVNRDNTGFVLFIYTHENSVPIVKILRPWTSCDIDISLDSVEVITITTNHSCASEEGLSARIISMSNAQGADIVLFKLDRVFLTKLTSPDSYTFELINDDTHIDFSQQVDCITKGLIPHLSKLSVGGFEVVSKWGEHDFSHDHGGL